MGCLSSKKQTSEDECSEIDFQKKKLPELPDNLRVKGSVALTLVKQDTVNDAVIEGMVKKEEVIYEMQNQEIIKNPDSIKCFKCKGTGSLYRRQQTLKAEELDLTIKKFQDEKGLQVKEKHTFPATKKIPKVIPFEVEDCYMCNGSGKTSE